MAHAAKYAAPATGHMLSHYDRSKDNLSGNIDHSRTHLNYNLAPERDCSQIEFMKQRLSEVPHAKRKDLIVMCDWAVTMPKEYSRIDGLQGSFDRGRVTELFFERTYQFLANRYGEENTISAYVHMDETSPHMHFSFVPVVYDPDTLAPKTISAKTLISRGELKCFHTDLERYLDSFGDYHFEVINEATKEGNRTVAELKQQSNIEKTKQTELELQAVKEKLEAYKSAEVSVEQIADAGIELPFGFVLQKKAESDAIKTTAQKYVASLEREKELAERESAAAVREIHADNYMREVDEKHEKFSVEQKAFKAEKEAFDKRAKALVEREKAVEYLEGLPAEYKALQDKNKKLSEENSALKKRISALETSFEQRVKDATQKLEKAVETLKENVRLAYVVLTNIVTAVGMLKYDTKEGYKVENLTSKQSKLIDAVAQYGAKWAKEDGFPGYAKDMEQTIGLCKSLRQYIEPTKQKPSKGYDDGPTLD